MNYITIKEAAQKWNVTPRSVQGYCKSNKIPGSKFIGKQWLIPSYAEKPLDGRCQNTMQSVLSDRYHFPLFVHSPYYSMRSELNDAENELFKAELLYLSGQFADCIFKCKKLLTVAVSPSVIFGSYSMIGYASVALGIYSEYSNIIGVLKHKIDQESLHKEDYKLILSGLLIHAEKDLSLLSDIDPEHLSGEAISYYQHLLILSSVTDFATESEKTLHFYLSCLRTLEADEIHPTALSVCCMISVLYSRLENKERQIYYMEKACEYAVRYEWYGLLVKYYTVDHDLIDSILSGYGKEHSITIKSLQKNVIAGWANIYKSAHGISILPEFTPIQNEILFLLSQGITSDAIAQLLNISDEHLDITLKEMIAASEMNSMESLISYWQNASIQSTR